MAKKTVIDGQGRVIDEEEQGTQRGGPQQEGPRGNPFPHMQGSRGGGREWLAASSGLSLA